MSISHNGCRGSQSTSSALNGTACASMKQTMAPIPNSTALTR